jgi:branched-subunit amino acid aminotransferase/4-amino-4-deoxychorismate lyase
MSVNSIYRWQSAQLHPLEYCDMTATELLVADSWFVTDGRALALGLHKQRFLAGVPLDDHETAEEFWDAAIAAIPADGDWFPRVELQARAGGLSFVFRLRSAPERTTSVILATLDGPDPRTQPKLKGPDLDAMVRVRTESHARGAGETVILSPQGFIVEGAYSSLLWWRGDALCVPDLDLERVDSVTARSILALATALGIDVLYEEAQPDDVDGMELWSVNALHGIRIVTKWIDGPQLAEQPGRLAAWRARLDRLRAPIR